MWCGECAALGVHGANRLGGNSLLEGVVFGELAGKKALKYIQNRELLPIDYNIVVNDQKWVDHIFDHDTSKNFNAMRVTLGKTMFELAGISRDKKSLTKAYDYLKYLRRESGTLHCIDKSRNNNVELISILELRNALVVAEAIVLSANERKESRGAHHRSDHKESLKDFEKHIFINELKTNFFKVWVEDYSFINRLRRLIIN